MIIILIITATTEYNTEEMFSRAYQWCYIYPLAILSSLGSPWMPVKWLTRQLSGGWVLALEACIFKVAQLLAPPIHTNVMLEGPPVLVLLASEPTLMGEQSHCKLGRLRAKVAQPGHFHEQSCRQQSDHSPPHTGGEGFAKDGPSPCSHYVLCWFSIGYLLGCCGV